jgi:hypothetical protein
MWPAASRSRIQFGCGLLRLAAGGMWLSAADHKTMPLQLIFQENSLNIQLCPAIRSAGGNDEILPFPSERNQNAQ